MSALSEPWFYTPHLPGAGEAARLDAREARHATGARRLGVGDAVCVFDGRGRIAHATIVSATNRDVVLQVKRVHEQAPPSPHLHLAAALPKGDRQNVLLSMATQLGISAFTPLSCGRSIVKPGPSFAERAERICVESCKQSRRAHVPVIHTAATVQQMVATAGADALIVLAHPGGQSARHLLQRSRSPQHVVILIGPEGGFTEEEVASAQKAGAEILSLGDGVLRIETAAAAALALLSLA